MDDGDDEVGGGGGEDGWDLRSHVASPCLLFSPYQELVASIFPIPLPSFANGLGSPAPKSSTLLDASSLSPSATERLLNPRTSASHIIRLDVGFAPLISPSSPPSRWRDVLPQHDIYIEDGKDIICRRPDDPRLPILDASPIFSSRSSSSFDALQLQ
ncbi:hypothetical protein SCHPADRAFT_944304 [Schizopora paradoxa]|uniref:Uncharacterized protein n=1 Tax=Schizopora paradoxa TaxID=27342 RepID=A0A0H2RGE2_9AGAM|nr:hypothetical protein SCHPADRAFT_944304 [Schizopora paradoxa]